MLYHAPADLVAQTASLSTEEQAKGMEGWMQWANKVGDKLVDMGTPLMNGQTLTASGENTASNRDVTGYSILQAESLEEAESLLQEHPHLAWSDQTSIELHEQMPLPGMGA